MIQLPQGYPFELLLEQCLDSFHQSLLGGFSLRAIRYGLDSSKVFWTDSSQKGYLVRPDAPIDRATEESRPDSEHHRARVLCFHSRGAHTVSFDTERNGLIDLRRDIHAEHFFPDLIPPTR
ncbi:MAG: hypothetical protein EBZ48_10735 [Proteobacteria bacterium]|nr:hypothetical protein [Pseudomonadota bacterium]